MTFALWTSPTPNGWKVTVMMEELIEAGVDLAALEVRTVNLAKGEQFSSEFTAHNPNQKIPVLIDGNRSIMESCAILQYLGEKYPTSLLPSSGRRWDVLQWLYWQAANIGPAFGNKLSYTRYMDDVDGLPLAARIQVEQGRRHRLSQCHGLDHPGSQSTWGRPRARLWRSRERGRSLERRAQGPVPQGGVYYCRE